MWYNLSEYIPSFFLIGEICTENIFLKRFIFVLLCTVLIGLCAFAYLCPHRQFACLGVDGESVYSLGTESITEKVNCTVADDGTLKATAEDPCLIFENVRTDARYVSLDAQGINAGVLIKLSYGTGGVFREDDFVYLQKITEDMPIVLELPDSDFDTLRLAASTYDYTFGGLDFYNSAGKAYYTIGISKIRYAVSAAVTVIAFAVLLLIDIKLDISGKTAGYIKRKYKRILVFIGATLLLGVLSFIAEYLIGNGLFQTFRKEWFALYYGVSFAVFAFVFFRRDIVKKPEKLTAAILLSAGLMLIISQPFGHIAWDLDSHFKLAVENSYFKTYFYSEGERVDGWAFTEENFDRNIDRANIERANEGYSEFFLSDKAEITLPYIHTGVAMALVRMFGGSLHAQVSAACVANLLLYTLLCYFGIRKLKSGKMIASVIVLLPTAVYVASNITYDYWVTGFIFLGMAYFVSMLQGKDEPFSLADTVIMCGAMVLGSLPKQVYLTVLVFTFFLRKKSFTKKDYIKYYAVCVWALALAALSLLKRSGNEAAVGGDIRGGSDVDVTGQIEFILADPIRYIGILFNFLKTYLSPLESGKYINYFAYLGYGKFFAVFLVLMVFTAFTDKEKCDSFKGHWWLNGASLVYLIGTSALIATALYVAFTPVGLDTVNGCSSRYIIPLLFPTLALIGNPGIRFKHRTVYNYAVLAVTSATLYFNIYSAVISRFY